MKKETSRFEAKVAEIPTHHNRIDALPRSLLPYVEECVELTEGVVHPHAVELARAMRARFLRELPEAHPLHRIYAPRAMSSTQAILRRLLTKRPLAFYGAGDTWMLDPKQNTSANGYGPRGGDAKARRRLAVWARFYGHKGGHFPLHSKLQPGTRYAKVKGNRFFDKVGYAKRMAMVLEPIFDSAIAHAQRIDKRAWVRLTGFGLGVWVLDKRLQAEIIVRTTGAIVRRRDPRAASIAAVEFLWYDPKTKAAFGASKWPKGRVIFSKTEPSAPLERPEDTFLVATFAWDGLSLVGNEYWDDALTASGDPAAACSSIIPQTMNPRINVLLAKKDVRVCQL